MRSSSTLSARPLSAPCRRRNTAALAAAVALLLASGAFAQETSGGLSTTIPTLRGAAGGDDDATTPALPSGPGGAITVDPGAADTKSNDAGTTGTAATPKKKFPFPKGTAKTADRLKVPRKGPPALPVLQAYPTSARPKGGGAVIDTLDSQILPSPTVAVLPAATRLRTKVDATPYDPVGIDVGSLRLTPFATQDFGYDTNPDQIQTGVKPSAFSRSEAGFGLLSDWSSNELRAAMHGAYNDYFSDPQANRPDAAGTVDLRVDVNRDAALDAEGRFTVDTQRAGSPEVSGSAIGRPLITTAGATLGGTETLGRLALGLHGSFDRVAYDNASLVGGGTEDLASENYNDFGLRGRVTYEITPAVAPFVDLFVDHREHDDTFDIAGFQRNSDGVTGQVGSTFEFDHLFTGEFSGGYGERTYVDKRLQNLDGPVFNGALNYAVTPLTLITLLGTTSFDETTVAGASGAQSRSVTLQVAHQLLRNLTVTGAVSYLNTEYVGVPITENTLAETLKAEYHLSRSLVGTATYSHEDLRSSLAGSSFSQDVFLLGLKLQR